MFTFKVEAKVDLHVHGSSVEGKLDDVLALLRAVKAQGERLMAGIKKDFDDLRQQIDEATNGVAARIDRLTAGIKNSMTDDEVAELKAGFGATSERLKTLGKDPENPVPPPPPEPTPTESPRGRR